MRSTLRLFLSAILLTTAAGIASAQDAGAALPPIPFAKTFADLTAADKPLTTTREPATKRIAAEPGEKASIQVSESFDAPAANAAAPLRSIAPLPVSEETKSQSGTGVGGWLLTGIAAAGLFSIVSLIRGRRTRRRSSVSDPTTVSPELEPAVVRVRNDLGSGL